jgi:prepilin-type N-terminal cleavage/methylation domain-containing protein
MTFAYKQPVLGAARECHCEAEGRGNLRRLDCFASLAMSKAGTLAMTDSRRSCRRGMTLTEMAVVIGIVAVMVGLTLPAANVLYNSFETTSGAKSMLNAALSSAKSIAIKEQRYAGIRFQKRYDPANPDPINESQYIIFIIKDKLGNLANGFRAVDGIQPIKLPDSIGVMDLEIRTNWVDPSMDGMGDLTINNNTLIDSSAEINATSTFSIIFSPSGKIAIHAVTVRNRGGDYQPITPAQSKYDDIFNSPVNIINNNLGMFIQDDYADTGYGAEMSRNKFYIYDTKKFKQAYKSGVPYTGYLNQLKAVYVNPYMGTIVEDK